MTADIVPTRYPLVAKPVSTKAVTERLKDIANTAASKPDLELVEVTAIATSTITVRKIGTTTTIPGVVPVGFDGSFFPIVGDFVWIMVPFPGATPIAIGTPDLKTPGCKVWASSGFNLANSVYPGIIFAMDANWTEEYKQRATHDFVTNNSRITILRDGFYLIDSAVGFSANGAGLRATAIYLNSATLKYTQLSNPNAVFADIVSCSTHKELVAGDYVEFGFVQNTGGAIPVVTGICTTYLSVMKLADLG